MVVQQVTRNSHHMKKLVKKLVSVFVRTTPSGTSSPSATILQSMSTDIRSNEYNTRVKVVEYPLKKRITYYPQVEVERYPTFYDHYTYNKVWEAIYGTDNGFSSLQEAQNEIDKFLKNNIHTVKFIKYPP
jgi:hypothetical protein